MEKRDLQDELIARCMAGEQEAFRGLYSAYSRAMYNVGYRITRNEDDAADVLQESFISAFRNLKHYRGDATFGAWLKRIVVNKAINVINRRRTEPLPDADGWDIEDDVAVEIEDDERAVDRIKKAIHQLPDGYRTVLSLYLMEGYDHQEIGEIMGVSESTSKSQLNRAKKKLREILEQSNR